MSRAPKKSPQPQLRVIGGQWRGRILKFAEVDGLRPTGNRIRETLFNWLMPVLPGARCLDAFAGSGALGFEALSRGAETCLMLETNKQAVTALLQNAQLLQANAAKILQADVLQWLHTKPSQTFDIVFLDPPFAQDLWQQTIEALEACWLADHAYIYIETPKNVSLNTPHNWRMHRQKSAGQVDFSLYIREHNR